MDDLIEIKSPYEGFVEWQRLCDDGEGTFYFTAVNYTIYRLTPGSLEFEQYLGKPDDNNDGQGCNGHRLKDARLADPSSLAADPRKGRLWVAEYEINCLRILEQDTLTTYAGNGTNVSNDGPIAQCGLFEPYSLMYLPHADSLLVTESELNHVRIIDCATEMIRTLAINEFAPNIFQVHADLYDMHPFDSFIPKYSVVEAKEILKAERKAVSIDSDKVAPTESKIADFAHAGPSSIVWMQSVVKGETWTVDWRTGESAMADLTFNPVASFGRTFLLAERDYNDRWLCVAKALPTGHMAPHPPLRRLCELYASSREYSTATNTLYTIKEGKHYIKPHILLPHPLLERYASNQIDFTPLLNSALVSDFKITHNESKKTWNLHLAVLEYCGLRGKTDRLREIVETSSLPISSIELFIDYILQKALFIEYNQRKTEEWIEVLILCQQADIEHSSLLFILRDNLETLSGVAGVDRILSLLDTFWHNSDLAIRKLLAFRALRLAQILGVLLKNRTSPNDNIIPFILSLSQDNDSSLNLQLTPVERHGSTELCWHKNVLDSASLLESPTDFVVTRGEQEFIVVKGWLMYTQWRWFAGLVNSGFYEARTRTVQFAHSLSPKAMMAILRAAHAPNFRELDDLELGDVRNVLEHAYLLGLVDGDDMPIGCFKPLIERCQYESKVFS